MIGTLIEKELKTILLSPKFVAVFSVCSILIVFSIYLGITEYKASMAQYESVSTNNMQQMRNARAWIELSTVVALRPDPMQIFVSGISNDIGRQAPISSGIKMYNSNYSENTIFAVFRSMDLMFIVQIVLSLFAILFTYDSISGEKETGTLKLSFANQVPRSKYIIAKIVGSWFGLVIPLLIPLLLGTLLIILNDIPFTGTHWLQFSLLMAMSFLYFSFFLCLGILISSITRVSSTSFLYLLVIWVCFVLIIPRAGVMVAGHFIPVPTSAEIASKFSQKNRELVEEYQKRGDETLKEQMAALNSLFSSPDSKSLSREELQAKSQEISDQYLVEIKKRGEKLSQDRAEYDAFLKEDWRNRKAVREKLGFSLSRFSPASAFQLAAANLAETGMSLKYNYEDQLRNYRDIFNKFQRKKYMEEKDSYQAMMDEKSKPIDISEVPQFEFVKADIKQMLGKTMIDMGVLSFYILFTIAGSFIAFIRYDVR